MTTELKYRPGFIHYMKKDWNLGEDATVVQLHTHYIYILYGELESQTGGAPGRDIQG